MRKRLRIFISSPGDVNEERLRAHLVIQKLARDYARFFEIDAYLWEHEPMLASGHFQDAIEPPSASDIVVLIVYARLGTALPARTTTREYRGIDGRSPVTGTEWEFEEALAASRARGLPDLLAYRKTGDPGLSLTDAARRAEQERQWQALESFWQRHFENAGLFLAGSSRFATVEEFDARLEADLAALIERRIAQDGAATAGAAAAEAPHWLKGSPFRGLAAYDFDDAGIFFGRDAQTRLALGRLQAAAGRGSAFLMVLGASGSGKSSLARAGLLPALVAPKAIPGVGAWRRVVLRPGDGGGDPVLRLATALAAGDPARGEGLPELFSPGAGPESFAAHLAAAADDPTYPFRAALDRVAAEERRARRLLPHEEVKLVLLVDQIEELFTRGIAPERRDTFLRIVAALARSGLAWVVATMRSDLWHRAAEARLLVTLTEEGARLDLSRPDGAEVIEIIRRPAIAAGLAFENDPQTGVGLDAVIARAAAEEPGVLPLLSVLLDTLYERDVLGAGAGGRQVLSFATYRALGELKGAIAERAGTALAALAAHDPEAAAALPRLLRALVTVNQAGDAVTSRPAPLDAFAEGSPEARLIAALVAPDARLLVASSRGERGEVRLAHEALLENWPAARQQIKDDRRDLETRARIEVLHRRWRGATSTGERRRTMLTGLNLAEAVDLMARWSGDADQSIAGFVRTSRRADRLRRGSFSAIAAMLALIFAGVAGFAGLESRRAESQAAAARAAAAAESTARTEAERERGEAERQRDRALASEERTAAALRVTRRQTARALSSQAELAADRQEFRRALGLAIEAGEAERGALDPGEPAVSETALLRSLADVRQALHIRRPTLGAAMPYAFVDDRRMVHADPQAGLVVTDLAGEPRVVAHVALPAGFLPVHLAPLPGRDLVAVAGDTRLLVIATGEARIAAQFTLPARITAIDADPAGQHVAVALPGAIAIADLAAGTLSEPVAVAAGPAAVGQIRFSRDGARLLLTAGLRILGFDPASGRFSDTEVDGELDASTAGIDRPLLESLLVKAVIQVVRVNADPTRDRLLFWHVGGVSAAAPGGKPRPFERDDPALRVLGVSFVDAARSGSLKEAVAVLVRPLGDTHHEFELRYISDEAKMLRFERFTVAADDVGGEKFDGCQVSRNASHLACQYWNRQREGLVVFRLMGGAHRFERAIAEPGADWAAFTGEGRVLLARGAALSEAGAQAPVAAGSLPDGFAAVDLAGRFVVAAHAGKGTIGIFRREPEARDASAMLVPVVAPTPARQAVVDPGRRRAVLADAARLSIHDLDSGARIASVPGLEGLRGLALSRDGSRLVALTDASVFVFTAATGRLAASQPFTHKPDAPFAFDPDASHLATVGADGTPLILDIASGATVALDTSAPAAFAWSADGTVLVTGTRDGSLAGFSAAGVSLWRRASPLGSAFSEGTAWPGQPPKGFVRALAVSPDGRLLAVARQDLPSIDLHDIRDGRLLTRLTSPWSWGVPARMRLGADGRVLAAWAIHAMTVDKPAFVSLHALPFGLDAALASARKRHAAIETVNDPALVPLPR